MTTSSRQIGKIPNSSRCLSMNDPPFVSAAALHLSKICGSLAQNLAGKMQFLHLTLQGLDRVQVTGSRCCRPLSSARLLAAPRAFQSHHASFFVFENMAMTHVGKVRIGTMLNLRL